MAAVLADTELLSAKLRWLYICHAPWVHSTLRNRTSQWRAALLISIRLRCGCRERRSRSSIPSSCLQSHSVETRFQRLDGLAAF